MKLITHLKYILLVDYLADIKKGSYFLLGNHINKYMGKRDIKYKSELSQPIIAHLPLNNAPLLEGVDLLPELPNQENAVEQLADKWVFDTNGMKWSNNDDTAGDNYGSFIKGYEANTNKYSEKDIRRAMLDVANECSKPPKEGRRSLSDLMKDILQSISILPTEFIAEYGGELTFEEYIEFPENEITKKIDKEYVRYADDDLSKKDWFYFNIKWINSLVETKYKTTKVTIQGIEVNQIQGTYK